MPPINIVYPYEISDLERGAIANLRDCVPAHWADHTEECIASLMRLAYKQGQIDAAKELSSLVCKE